MNYLRMKCLAKSITGLCLCFVLVLSATSAFAQTAPASDTTKGKVFSLRDFQELVLLHHPIVKQAALLSDEARTRVLQSWGGFDPLLKASLDRKEFGNTRYYNYWYSELKVPLYLAGADLKVGYDRNVGTYINPDKRTGRDGLSSVGLSVPIGAGLLIDSRRNTLQQARLMVGYAEAERIKQINEVWLAAARDYWNWYNAYMQYLLIEDGIKLAQTRYDAVAAQVQLGDKPPIDSIEASITVFDRRLQFEKLKMELQNTRLLLSNNLWSEDGNPLELPATAIPQEGAQTVGIITQGRVDSLVSLAGNQHPELLKLRNKSDQLGIESRYRREMLKPKLNVSGSLVSNRTDFKSDLPEYYDYNWQNYKIGIDFALPLFLRSERGKLKEVNIKQRQLGFDLQQTGRDIQNDIYTSYNSLQAYEAQLNIQTRSINNQQLLLNGETQKFELGESTLFLINSRETKLIEMKIKRVEIIADYQKKIAELYYKAGTRQAAGF
jgi:outer membrane protein TolC